LDRRRAGVHSLNIAPSQSVSILHCAFNCYNTNGCYDATFHGDTNMCEYLTTDTGVEADDTLMLIPLGWYFWPITNPKAKKDISFQGSLNRYLNWMLDRVNLFNSEIGLV
jgi:hypothetical protein